MTLRLSRLLAIAVLAAVLATPAACESLGPTGAVTGEVRFAREVALPEGTVVTVKLLDTTLADAPSMELGRDVIENADRLPVSFRIEYDRGRVSDRNEYSLSADVRHGDDLLYVNDTVHPVLTRGAPGDSDVVVVSTNPLDTCVAPLPGQIHSERDDEAGIPQIKPTFLDIAPSGIPSNIIPHSKGVKCGLIRSNSPFSYSNHRPAKPKIPKPLVYAQVSPLGTSFATP